MLALDAHYQKTQDEASAVAHELRRQSYDRDMRVATWMLVGNGAALLACFNAIIAGTVCNWSSIQPFAASFLVGIGTALASVVVEGELVSRVLRRLTLMGGATRRAAIGIDANTELRQLEERGVSDPEVVARIAENEKLIKEAIGVLQKEAEEPLLERCLRWIGKGLLF